MSELRSSRIQLRFVLQEALNPHNSFAPPRGLTTIWRQATCCQDGNGKACFPQFMKAPLTKEELNELTTGLNILARNLWWTWDQEAQDVFQELSPRGWQNLYHNAVAILREVSDYELKVRLQDPDFAQRVREVLRAFEAYMNDQLTWGHRHGKGLQQN